MNNDVLAIGPHRVTNASLEHCVVDTMLEEFGDVRVLYVDPPWGDRMMKFFSNLNAKQTGERVVPLPFNALLDRVFSLARRYVHGFVCMETGTSGADGVVRAFEGAGLYGVDLFRSVYNTDRACYVVIGATSLSYADEKIKTVVSPVEGKPLTGVSVPKHVLSRLGGDGCGVIDPCCGMGYTAKAAVHNRMRFAGNELNAKRLQKTIDFLTKSEAA
jgi:hypothetical protein